MTRLAQIAQQLDKLQQRIEAAASTAGRNADEIQLLAVSKTRPAEDLQAAITAGQTRFGESYLQEALEKINALSHLRCEWHFIGPCQSNKTAAIATAFGWVHSIDRIKIAQRLNDQRTSNQRLNICLQVNISKEASKSGIEPSELPALAEAVAAMPRLHLRGLMALPAAEADFDKQRAAFAQVRGLFNDLHSRGHQLDTLSMGMSHDMEAAIMEGATLVRIGTDIFGQRPDKHKPSA